MADVTLLLESYRIDGHASDELIDVVYQELHRIAQKQWAQEKPGQTLQPTALVNEAYIRLFDGVSSNWENRRHFFGAAAEVMRRVLVDQARRKTAAKRGGEMKRRSLDDIDIPAARGNSSVTQIDEALTTLASNDPEAAELVKLRYFAGLTLQQASEALGISRATADRHWGYAKTWLYCALSE